MSEFKVIEENEHGVLVECFAFIPCAICKYDELRDCFLKNRYCENGRYLTEQEEQEYYSSQRV